MGKHRDKSEPTASEARADEQQIRAGRADHLDRQDVREDRERVGGDAERLRHLQDENDALKRTVAEIEAREAFLNGRLNRSTHASDER